MMICKVIDYEPNYLGYWLILFKMVITMNYELQGDHDHESQL
jgi:hypothetical protein